MSTFPKVTNPSCVKLPSNSYIMESNMAAKHMVLSQILSFFSKNSDAQTFGQVKILSTFSSVN